MGDPSGRPSLARVQAKSELTLSELWIRLIASPRRRAMLTCLIRGHALALAERGIESVTTTSEMGAWVIRSMAGPERTPWLAQATMRLAPSFFRAWAAPARV